MINDIYNLKVIHYKERDSIRLYSRPIVCKDRKEVDADGCIYVPDVVEKELEVGPFGEIKKTITDDDDNRSAKVSMNRTVNKIYSICRSNYWDYFFTLTFAPDKVNRYDFDDCQQKMTTFLNNLRKRQAPDMKYIIVPEKHKDGAWHFHGLFANIGNCSLIDSGKKDNKGRVIYNLGNYKLGWSTVTSVEHSEKASSYLVKYINKDLCSELKNRKKYFPSRNLEQAKEETFLIEGSYLDKLKLFSSNASYLKSVKSDFVDVTYIELEGRINDIF